MNIENTSIEGLFQIEYDRFNDERGLSAKIFCKELLKDLNVNFNMNDLFFSMSNKNVIRGMHFQNKPFEQEKLVCVVKGKIIDVVIDLRPESRTFKKYEEFKLNESDNKAIFIPKGCAHGFRTVEDNTMVLYAISGQYSKENDIGIRWDSFGYDWACERPIISERDRCLDRMSDYIVDLKKY